MNHCVRTTFAQTEHGSSSVDPFLSPILRLTQDTDLKDHAEYVIRKYGKLNSNYALSFQLYAREATVEVLLARSHIPVSALRVTAHWQSGQVRLRLPGLPVQLQPISDDQLISEPWTMEETRY